MSVAVAQRESLLNDVEQAIASITCRIFDYSKIGKPTCDWEDRRIALLNYQFLLCNSDLDACDVECVRCAYERLKP